MKAVLQFATLIAVDCLVLWPFLRRESSRRTPLLAEILGAFAVTLVAEALLALESGLGYAFGFALVTIPSIWGTSFVVNLAVVAVSNAREARKARKHAA